LFQQRLKGRLRNATFKILNRKHVDTFACTTVLAQSLTDLQFAHLVLRILDGQISTKEFGVYWLNICMDRR
jgi:hypothetical protein